MHRVPAGGLWSFARVLQILEEKPSGGVDLLEASLLAKKGTFDAKESSPLVPIPVSPVESSQGKGLCWSKLVQQSSPS